MILMRSAILVHVTLRTVVRQLSTSSFSSGGRLIAEHVKTIFFVLHTTTVPQQCDKGVRSKAELRQAKRTLPIDCH